MAIDVIHGSLPHFFPGTLEVREPAAGDELPTLRVLLSRARYWAEDGHLDIVVQLDESALEPRDVLRIRILTEDGRELKAFEIAPLPGPRMVIYPSLPPELAGGGRAVLETARMRAGEVLDSNRQPFRVERGAVARPESGRIALQVSNEPRASIRQVPFTVGVPFPRGVLADPRHLRLVAEDGREIPLQTLATARWSRHGSMKWVLCDFVLDIAGAPKTLYLEYGPEVRRDGGPPVPVTMGAGFPRLEAGRLKVDGGLWYDRDGSGDYVQVLDERAMSGAFVVRPDGRRYRAPLEDRYEIEEQGPCKVVIRREGWYRRDGGDDTFCRYITRYVIHRDSPMLRIFHTWIFTGDGNREPIANMGWEFPLAEGFADGAFLATLGGEDAWHPGRRLLQYDYEHFLVEDEGGEREHPGGRAPGAASATGRGLRFTFGARDFWQNYPSELEFHEGSLWFHNWPRNNRPARYTFEGERLTAPGEPALPSAARHEQYRPGRLTRSEWKLNVIQARFAHEGESLDFRLPDALAEDPIWSRHSQGSERWSAWDKGRPETANAQGISRTEEIWLYIAPDQEAPGEAARLFQGLNRETLRATVDPAWVAASGAFLEIHPRDVENYPEDERTYALLAGFPGRIIERLGLYGMWIYGDIAAYNPGLARREPGLYRAWRKAHQGWPYPWIPFARSGDPEWLRRADAATRQMIDANYCHWASEEVDLLCGPDRHRRPGRWNVSPIPWAGIHGPSSRDMHVHCEYLWHAWYLTGYHRAKDNALDWGLQTRIEEPLPRRGRIRVREPNRNTIVLLKAYLDMYRATFDPWFLAAAHAIAEGHLRHFQSGDPGRTGHFWQPGDRDYERFTGREDYRPYYLAYADGWGRHDDRTSWAQSGSPMIEPLVHAWRLTGHEYYLRRTAAEVHWARVSVFEADSPSYLLGHHTGGVGMTRYHAWYLNYFPLALAVFESAGARPDPLSTTFLERLARRENGEGEDIRYAPPAVYLRKEAGIPLPVSFNAVPMRSLHAREGERYSYRVRGPGGDEVLAGSFLLRDRCELDIPAEAPAGTYLLEVESDSDRPHLGLEVPVSPPGTPEVLAWGPGRPAAPNAGTAFNRQPRYWFHVPEALTAFDVVFVHAGRAIRRASVWNPDGERIWDSQTDLDEDGHDLRITIPVAAGQGGRLWHITLPSGGSFTLDPRIPPFLAAERERWFLPE